MVRSLEARQGDVMRLKLTIEDERAGKIREVYLEGDELGAALVMFCIHNGVPLPATGATKQLELIDGRLALTVIKTFDVDANFTAATASAVSAATAQAMSTHHP